MRQQSRMRSGPDYRVAPTAPGVTEVLFLRAANSSGAMIESVHLIRPCDLQGSAPCKVLHAPEGGGGLSEGVWSRE